MPGNVESPEQVNRFVKRFHFLRHLHRQPNHLDEEEHEEHEEPVSKPFRRQPSRRYLPARPFQRIADLQKQLSASAIVVAVALSTSENSHQ